MRFAICIISAVLVVAGCRQQATHDTEGDRSAATEAPHTAPQQTEAAEADDAGAAAANDNVIALDEIRLTAPAGWQRKPASSSFVAAEFLLPRAEGDDADGRLTVSTAGGSVEANIDRWKTQFNPPPNDVEPEEIEAGGFKVTVIDLSGEFNDQRGPFAPGQKRPNFRMIGAIIPVDRQLHFIKATGPQKTIGAHADSIREFIGSVRPNQ